MKSLFNLALLTSIVATVSVSFVSVTILELLIPIALIILVLLSKDDVNSQLLTLCFTFVFTVSAVALFILKTVVFQFVESYFIQNIYAFSIQLTLSLLMLFLLKHRMTIAVILTKGKSASVFEKNYAEGPLYFLVLTMVFIDFAALMENFLRNLELLGLNEETAKMFWEVTFFFDYFAYLKAVPIFLCVLLLYIGLIVRTKRQPIQN
ncbi:hypothetical protein [Pseudoalteromonas maricaloris]|uniref:Uncharacterized protein n=1 Tax=Pseudoalteromonas maricaloris TaxID=184924 RepID=A0A8I2H0I6_9GAMM|nr:hypothetical protein [Pseudoalteromonas maricaloris]NLR20921.1 hypothetical protein [Pseudoalteromonas maricaloris]WOX30839.1 hypothetical protein R5H13_23455 [Pseudoalteromonas maricaloris]